MSHLYLFTLEVEPLEIGRAYDELPSHLTLMSRFLSDLNPKELSYIIRPAIDAAGNITLTFGPTTELGPKKSQHIWWIVLTSGIFIIDCKGRWKGQM